jgi:hypothetical protein
VPRNSVLADERAALDEQRELAGGKPHDLAVVAPQLGERRSLQPLHIAIQGDFFLDETHEVTAARVLAHACDQLGQISTAIVAALLPGSPASAAPTRSKLTPRSSER